jgi:hypothetical protein
VYFPAVHKNTDRIYSIEQNGIDYGNDLIQHLFYDPRYKLCSIKSAPHSPKNSESFNSDTWQSLESDLLYRRKLKQKSSLVIARGPDHPISNIKGYPTLMDKHRFYNYSKSMTLLDNGQEFMEPLEKILERGYCMLKESAYVYQYEKDGIGKEEIAECFAKIENILTCYSKL